MGAEIEIVDNTLIEAEGLAKVTHGSTRVNHEVVCLGIGPHIFVLPYGDDHMLRYDPEADSFADADGCVRRCGLERGIDLRRRQYCHSRRHPVPSKLVVARR